MCCLFRYLDFALICKHLNLTYLVIFVSVVLFCKTTSLSSFMYLTNISVRYFCRICISGSIKTLTNGIAINIRRDKYVEILATNEMKHYLLVNFSSVKVLLYFILILFSCIRRYKDVTSSFFSSSLCF